ncbi:uncharacterized protein LOC116839346 isoform X8 [Chelonoidis abingdonii]|uniref:uncharacterized protein LOC116839346 isoform X8 n=1 Tax=Chelonoidis abingdonii TaxID=106734 RepID=UPI003F493BBD
MSHPVCAGTEGQNQSPLSISWLLPLTLLAGHCAAPFPAHLGAGDRGREHLPSSSIPSRAKPRSAQQKWAEEEEEEWVEEEEEEEEKEEEDVSPEQDTIRVTQEHLQGRAELVKDRAQQLLFLHAVPRLCFLAQQQGWTFWSPTSPKQPLWRALQ